MKFTWNLDAENQQEFSEKLQFFKFEIPIRTFLFVKKNFNFKCVQIMEN